MAFPRPTHLIPEWRNAVLALAAAGLLILAFPDFELWWTAWFALVPLMWAVERQKHCVSACFTLGWIFGTTFFFGTGWWLTYAPIHYAAMPWPLAYLLIFIVCLISGLFPALFTTLLAILIRRFGTWAFLAAPFVWVCTEFLRYWATGNNWNAIGYSQAFVALPRSMGFVAGPLGLSFLCVACGCAVLNTFTRSFGRIVGGIGGLVVVFVLAIWIPVGLLWDNMFTDRDDIARVIMLQPNVPMSGMDYIKSYQFRNRHIAMAEEEIKKLRTADRQLPTVVILPESPMNFAYTDDREFQQFIGDFARKNKVSVLFNSSEPDSTNGKYFNSAVMVGPDGRKIAEYNKIYLLPFGEAVPAPLDQIMPAFVGTFSYGQNYSLMPVGDAKAGVMICFESHFGSLGREYVKQGADVIIEMTNDGYLGPTPVLRQHLANAVFRAVETNRPVLRVTNVGITAYITETGQVIDPAPTYQEATRVWSVSKSDGSQTFYVKYGDWFAWLCMIVTIVLLGLTFRRRHDVAKARA